ncbi:MAG TPA: hypothetical protein VF444_15565 [Pseudonocardiaceae bacterium]
MPSDGRRPTFGRIDPVVWVPVAAIVIVAMLFLFGGFPPLGIGLIVLAGILVLLDSWFNRPPARRLSPAHPSQRARRPQGRQRRDIR